MAVCRHFMITEIDIPFSYVFVDFEINQFTEGQYTIVLKALKLVAMNFF